MTGTDLALCTSRRLPVDHAIAARGRWCRRYRASANMHSRCLVREADTAITDSSMDHWQNINGEQRTHSDAAGYRSLPPSRFIMSLSTATIRYFRVIRVWQSGGRLQARNWTSHGRGFAS